MSTIDTSNMTKAQLLEALAAAQAENEALKVKRVAKITLKVSELGAVSIYGMGRFPITIYAEHLVKLLGMGEEVKAFLEANKDKLSTGKDDPRFLAVRAARAAAKAEAEAKAAAGA